MLEIPDCDPELHVSGDVTVIEISGFPASVYADESTVRSFLDGYEEAVRSAMAAVPAFEASGRELLERFADRVIDLGIVR